VTSTATELNIMDGDTAASSTTLADADRVVVNDAGTMKQVALTDFETYFESSIDTFSTIDINGGSIDGATLGTNSAITQAVIDDIDLNGKVITMTGSTSDTAVFTAGTNGTLSIVTTDDAAAAANIQITADGTVDIDSAGVLTLDSGAAINLEPASGSAILLDGTISVDAGVVTGATSITSTAFVGALTGNVTGNASGTAATVTGGTQASITTCANLVETGALNAGTITSGFGNIDNGSSTLDTGAVDCAAITTSGTLNMSDNIITGIHSLDTDIDTVAYGASVALDFDDNEEIILGELTGAITFTTSNRALGKHKTIHIDCDGTDRAFTFPSWVWIGAVPTTATANKRSVLSLTCLGTADTDIRAVFTSEA